MRLFDVTEHDITLVQALLIEATLHELQVSQLIRVARLWLRQHSVVKHLLVNFEELLLGPINVDQGRYDIVLASFCGDKLHWLALL